MFHWNQQSIKTSLLLYVEEALKQTYQKITKLAINTSIIIKE